MAAVHESHENYSEVRCLPTRAHSLDCKKRILFIFLTAKRNLFPSQFFSSRKQGIPGHKFQVVHILETATNPASICFISSNSSLLPYITFQNDCHINIILLLSKLAHAASFAIFSNLSEATKTDFFCFFCFEWLLVECYYYLTSGLIHSVLLFCFCCYTLMNMSCAVFFLQTAHCYIHAAALVAEYLKRQGNTPKITETEFLLDHFSYMSLVFQVCCPPCCSRKCKWFCRCPRPLVSFVPITCSLYCHLTDFVVNILVCRSLDQLLGSLRKHDVDGSENVIWKCNFSFP